MRQIFDAALFAAAWATAYFAGAYAEALGLWVLLIALIWGVGLGFGLAFRRRLA